MLKYLKAAMATPLAVGMSYVFIIGLSIWGLVAKWPTVHGLMRILSAATTVLIVTLFLIRLGELIYSVKQGRGVPKD